MKKRGVGASEVDVSVVVFGAWAAGGWMWGGNERAKSVEAIRASIEVLGRIRPLAEARGLTLAQLVIAWTLAQPGVTAALVGARDGAQARANARGGEVELTAEEIREIDQHLEALSLEGV